MFELLNDIYIDYLKLVSNLTLFLVIRDQIECSDKYSMFTRWGTNTVANLEPPPPPLGDRLTLSLTFLLQSLTTPEPSNGAWSTGNWRYLIHKKSIPSIDPTAKLSLQPTSFIVARW